MRIDCNCVFDRISIVESIYLIRTIELPFRKHERPKIKHVPARWRHLLGPHWRFQTSRARPSVGPMNGPYFSTPQNEGIASKLTVARAFMYNANVAGKKSEKGVSWILRMERSGQTWSIYPHRTALPVVFAASRFLPPRRRTHTRPPHFYENLLRTRTVSE